VKIPPTDALQDSVAVAGEGGRVTLLGLMAVHVRPEGSGVSESKTVPAKPLAAVTVIVEIAVCVALTAAGEVAVIWKSLPNVNVAVAV